VGEMVKKTLKIKLLVALLLGAVGCNLIDDGKPAIIVEEVKLVTKEGVEIEDISAVPSSLSLGDSETRSFYVITNKSIQDALKSKLGTAFIQLEEKYQSALENEKPLSQVPELGIEYKFRPQVNGIVSSEPVCFKLSDAFDGLGVILSLNGKHIEFWSGVPRLERKAKDQGPLLQERTELVVDLFDLNSESPLYQIGLSSYFGIQKVSGGSLYLLVMSDDHFKLTRSVSTLPTVVGTTKVLPRKHDAQTLKAIGLPYSENSFLIYFTDESSKVLKVFHMDHSYVFKDVSASCGKINQSGMLPLGLNCGS